MHVHTEDTVRQHTAAGHWGETTLLDVLDGMARDHADRPALDDPPDRAELVGSAPTRLTWAEFGERVDNLAAALHARGVGKDDVVVVQLPNVWELPALYFAIAKAGGLIAPMPVQWRGRELRHIVELTGATTYIGARELKGSPLMAYADETLPATVTRLELAEVTAAAETPAPQELRLPTIDANDAFTLCWTSGTEAEPKGCPLTHNNWLFQGRSFRQATALQDGYKILGPAPIVNMTGVGITVMWLLSGGHLLLHQPLNLPVLLQQLPEAEFSVLVPAILMMLLKLPEEQIPDLAKVRSIGTGSAPPPAWAIEGFRERWGIEVTNVFGQNEGTILAAGADDVPDPVKRSNHFPWWGRPGADWPSGVAGIDVRIVDDEGKELTEPGAVGELAYRGPNVFPGYFRAPQLNEGLFTAEGHVRTGDLFTVLDDRHIGFVDRKKDIIIRGGFNVSAAEVETVASGHPGVADCAAVASPDEVLGERVCVFVVPLDPQTPPTLAELVEYMRGEGIAIYKLPERMELIDAIPRNPVGKIVKKELRDRLKELVAK
jgi:acyl-CoA synthetase (AMP-forming)/AMP-acid ligase II